MAAKEMAKHTAANVNFSPSACPRGFFAGQSDRFSILILAQAETGMTNNKIKCYLVLHSCFEFWLLEFVSDFEFRILVIKWMLCYWLLDVYIPLP